MSCKGGKHKARRIAPEVEWCTRCGSFRRQQLQPSGARTWTRWVPCGVQRLPRRQLTLDELDELAESMQRAAAETSEAARQLELENTAAASGTAKPTLRIVPR